VLTLPALLAGALLYASLRTATTVPEPPLLPPSWRIEPPLALAGVSAREALVRARRALLSVATLCPALVLVHVWASWVYEWRKSRKAPGTAEGERASVPREEARRAKKYVLFSLGVTAGALVLKAAFVAAGCGIWMGLGIVETGVAALAYQLALYAVIRLAHRGLTLGELGLVCFGGLAVVLEALHLSAARVRRLSLPPCVISNTDNGADLAARRRRRADVPTPDAAPHASNCTRGREPSVRHPPRATTRARAPARAHE
jgi:dolichol kinase